MDTALESRLTRMEQRIAELERENQSLRAVPDAKQDAREGEVLPRRALLTGAAYTLGAVGLSLMGTRRAEATTGFMQYGNTNFANYSFTSLHSVHSLTTLDVINASPSGEALRTFSNGTSINAKVAGLSSPGHAVQAQADGFGHAVLAFKNSEFGNCVLAIHDSPPARMPQFTEGRRVPDLECMVTARARARASWVSSPMQPIHKVRSSEPRKAPGLRSRAPRFVGGGASSRAKSHKFDPSVQYDNEACDRISRRSVRGFHRASLVLQDRGLDHGVEAARVALRPPALRPGIGGRPHV